MWGKKMIMLDIADEAVVPILGWGRVFAKLGTSKRLLFEDSIPVVGKHLN